VTCYGLPEAKITVIPEAAAPGFGPQDPDRVASVREKLGLPDRYVLTVGTIEPRKNLGRLLESVGPLLSERLIDGLVIVGAKGWLYEGFFEALERCAWRDRVILPGFVPEADLSSVYTGASVTAVPSLYEGFGLPVLEAMACGSPVCASEVASLPEVGGDAAAYFPPADTRAMTRCLRRVLADASLRQEMVQSGLRRAALFSWERTARETMDLYEQTIEGSAPEAGSAH